MKNFRRYLKFKLKYSYSFENIKRQLGGAKGMGTFVFVAICLLIAAVSVAFVYLFLLYSGLLVGKITGKQDVFIKFVLSIGQFIILFFSIFSAFGLMYGGKDSDLISTLPIKSSHVFMANLTGTYIPQLGLSAVIILPLMIMYTIMIGANAFFWIYGIIGLFFYPVIPVVLAAILVMLFTSITANFKHKELFGTILGFVFIAGLVLFQMIVNTSSSEITGDALEAFINKIESTAGYTENILIGGGYLGRAMTTQSISGILYLLVVIAISVGLIILSAFLGDKLYYRLLQKQRASGASSAKKFEKKQIKRSGVVKAFFKKEWLTVLRTPAYMINGLANIIIGPIIFVFFAMNSSKYGLPQDIQEMSNAIMLPIVLGIALLVGMMNYVWSTTITREGHSFWIIKTAPISVKEQIKGRFLAGYSMHLIYCITMLTVEFAMMKFSLLTSVLMALVLLVAGVYMTAVGIMLDVRNPKFEWKTETEAIKSSINGLFEMLISFGISLIVVAPTVIGIFAGLNLNISAAISLGLAVIFAVIFYFSMLKYTDKKFKSIRM